MSSDPFIRAWRREAANRLRYEGPWVRIRELGLLAIAISLAAPLVRPTFLAFLDRDPAAVGEGIAQVVMRGGTFAVGWMAIDTYFALLRSSRRDVLALLPVDGAGVVRSELVRLAVARSWLVPALALLLSPLATHGAAAAWARSVVALGGDAALGLTASTVAHLMAIRIARSSAWAPVLDRVRGQNPRSSAAFLYAPAVVLAATMPFVAGSAYATVHPEPVWLAALISPWAAAAVAALPIPALARASWFDGSAVLAETDGRWAAVAAADERRQVYLEWAVRFLPAAVRPFALDDLRHGWRARRTLVTGGWLAGLAALGAGWSDPGPGGTRAAAAVVIGVFAVAANGVLLGIDEPPFLRATLPRGATALAARGVVLIGWCAPVVALGAIGAVPHGVALTVGAVGAAAAVVASGLSLACGQLRERGLGWYGPAAVVAAALFVVGGT